MTKRKPENISTDVTTFEILRHFYPDDTPGRRLLLRHSAQVRDKALAILALPANAALHLDLDLVSRGAMLHDIGIGRCHAPSIGCEGSEPYIAHGVIGAAMLRQLAEETGQDFEACARICERHTGSGITAAEVEAQGLPIPVRDYLPVTPEEQLVCLADKFFSKSAEGELAVADVRRSLFRFGVDAVDRFDSLCDTFSVPR